MKPKLTDHSIQTHKKLGFKFLHIYFSQHFQKIMGYNRLMQKYIKEEMHNFMKRGSVPAGRPAKLYCEKTNTS
ncbi:MAG: hypothetical protein AYK18_11410 [Theionarchaea archaeon DG-70]|nr:MAG: hypothetical protein AYK18_11410 [Theionarchaea archaeon DG-70]